MIMVKYYPLIICMIFNITHANAAELVHDTQAFVYYKIPIGGSTPEDRAHQYGFRMDHSWIEQDQVIDMNQLMSRNAVMDFRMSSREQPKFEIQGVDYLQKYRVNKADAGSSEAADAAVSGEAQAEEAPQTAEAETAPSGQAEAETGITDGVMDSLSEIPIGMYVGMGILAAILAGD